MTQVLVQSFAANGIIVGPSAHRTAIAASVITQNGANGIATLPGVVDVRIDYSDCTSNGASGIAVAAGTRVTIARCDLSGNAGAGLTVGGGSYDIAVSQSSMSYNSTNGLTVAAGCANLAVADCSFAGNVGAGAVFTGAVRSLLTNSTFEQNTGGLGAGGAIALVGACSQTDITGNKIFLKNGASFVPVAAILLGGTATGCTVSTNEISGYNTGIHLLGIVGGLGPFANSITGNIITGPLSQGLQLASTSGSNVFSGNSVSSSAGNGVLVTQSGVGDEFDGNTIVSSTLSGVLVNAATGGAVTGLRIARNILSANGLDGVTILAAPGAVLGLIVSDNIVSENQRNGLSIGTAGVAGGVLGAEIVVNRVEKNEVSGITINSSPGCSVRNNRIAGNLGVGVLAVNDTTGMVPPPGVPPTATLTIARNTIDANYGGGISLGAASSPLCVVEENAICNNQGFGLLLAAPPPLPLPGVLPYPLNISLGSNWWGTTSGPSGASWGDGNAVLGLAAGFQNAIFPVLPAPAFAGWSADAAPILRAPQVSVLPTFAAGNVAVNRLDTARVNLAFRNVEARTPGAVSTAAYTSAAMRNFPACPGGTPLAAAAILVTGLMNGQAEIAFAYTSEDLLEGRGAEALSLWGYCDGTWSIDSVTGTWMLGGGKWEAFASCGTPGSQLVIADVPVSKLLGSANAIVLVRGI
jgi:hypothetical protein